MNVVGIHTTCLAYGTIMADLIAYLLAEHGASIEVDTLLTLVDVDIVEPIPLGRPEFVQPWEVTWLEGIRWEKPPKTSGTLGQEGAAAPPRGSYKGVPRRVTRSMRAHGGY